MTFEEWIKSNGGSTDRTDGGEYRSAPTECACDAWQVAYDAGRAAALEDAAKVCGDFDIPDIVEGAHPDYVEGKRMAVAQIAHKIGELK